MRIMKNKDIKSCMNKLSLILIAVFLFDSVLQGEELEQSLRNKIGEMLIIGFHEDEFLSDSLIAKNIESYHVGGVILYSGSGLGTEQGNLRNIKNPTQLQDLTHALQLYAKKHRLSDEGPLFIGIDHEGGWVSRFSNVNGFIYENISPKELGSANDLNKTSQYSESLGQFLKSLGINLNFAPVVDLAVNPDNFIYKRERSFSADPRLVYSHALAFVKGMHAHEIKTALKHFPGHGSSLSDTHKGIADITNTWTENELEPYRKFIEKGYCEMIMTSHVINRQLDGDMDIQNKLGEWGPRPATFSRKMLTDLLRNQLGFQGVIVTDDMSMGAIADQYDFEDALKHAINAGVDMIILANHSEDQTGQAIEIIEKLVDSGELSPQRIDDAYNRILSLKKGLCLLK